MERTREKRKRENTFKLILKVACLQSKLLFLQPTTNGNKERKIQKRGRFKKQKLQSGFSE